MFNRITAAIRDSLVAHAHTLLEDGMGIEDGARSMMASHGITKDRARNYMAKALRQKRGQEIGEAKA